MSGVTSGDFVAHELEQFGSGADEGDTGFLACPGEGGVFGEEPIAGVDEIDVVLFGEGDDTWDIEVSGDGAFALADEVGFIGLEAVQAETVFLGVDGDGSKAEFGGGAEDPDRDLAAVGYEEFTPGFLGGDVGLGWI